MCKHIDTYRIDENVVSLSGIGMLLYNAPEGFPVEIEDRNFDYPLFRPSQSNTVECVQLRWLEGL